MTTTRRRTAGEPQAKSNEFVRVFWLLGLVVVLGGAFFLFQYSALQRAERAEAARVAAERNTLVPKEKLSPEQIEARKTALLSKFEGALADTENDSPLNYNETPGYRKLLETLIRFTPEEVTQRTHYEFDWKTVMDDPDGWRGEFVRARGILSYMWAIKLKSPVLGRGDVYRAFLDDGDNQFVIDLTERPPDLKADSRDVLDVEGVFYRTARYEDRNGTVRTLPLIVVRNVQRVGAASETGWRAWMAGNGLWIIAGMAIFVISLALLFSAFRKQRRPPRSSSGAGTSFQDMFDQKLRESGKVPPSRD
jgi:cbb3-type cytochrome oxidase subunit 3